MHRIDQSYSISGRYRSSASFLGQRLRRRLTRGRHRYRLWQLYSCRNFRLNLWHYYRGRRCVPNHLPIQSVGSVHSSMYSDVRSMASAVATYSHVSAHPAHVCSIMQVGIPAGATCWASCGGVVVFLLCVTRCCCRRCRPQSKDPRTRFPSNVQWEQAYDEMRTNSHRSTPYQRIDGNVGPRDPNARSV